MRGNQEAANQKENKDRPRFRRLKEFAISR